MGTAVSEAIKGTAAGVLNTSAQLGTAIGTALMLLVATSLQPRTSWIVAAVLAGVAAVCACGNGPTTELEEPAGLKGWSRAPAAPADSPPGHPGLGSTPVVA